MSTTTKKLPKQKTLREDFTYNPLTGSFIRYDGQFGFIEKAGYWVIKYEGKAYKVHRLIWRWWYGYTPDEVDHINGDKLDNRIDNLRSVDSLTNNRNRPKQTNNSSGFNGITWHNHTCAWQARISLNGNSTYIGVYETAQKAHEARQEYIKEFCPGLFTERHGT